MRMHMSSSKQHPHATPSKCARSAAKLASISQPCDITLMTLSRQVKEMVALQSDFQSAVGNVVSNAMAAAKADLLTQLRHELSVGQVGHSFCMHT